MQLEQTIADATAQTRAISLYGVRNNRALSYGSAHGWCASAMRVPLRVAAGLTR
ncbi:hypothetical protein VSR34_36240 [Paraburkholderia sp. JHI2823]|uniref:hypothetical protein n=1 Tax=Paraburkholderia TaxID=1822464 RepID=UPI003173C751